MPPAVTKLWSLIRRQQLGVKFRRQVAIGPYYADFANLPLKLVVELDGAQHADEAARAHDAARDAYLSDAGWTVLRFWNHEVYDAPDDVLWAIKARCDALAGG